MQRKAIARFDDDEPATQETSVAATSLGSVMRNRNLSREEALEEYLVYRKRIGEFLDMVQIAKDIKNGTYQPRDLLGRGPARYSMVVRNVLVGLFASLFDPQKSAMNVFDVWLVLFPEKKSNIVTAWEHVKPHIQLIRDYRNDVVCHANKRPRRYIKTSIKFEEGIDGVHVVMQVVAKLAAELLKDETTSMPPLHEEIRPILKRLWPDLTGERTLQLENYFLSRG